MIWSSRASQPTSEFVAGVALDQHVKTADRFEGGAAGEREGCGFREAASQVRPIGQRPPISLAASPLCTVAIDGGETQPARLVRTHTRRRHLESRGLIRVPTRSVNLTDLPMKQAGKLWRHRLT
jgi:hypothetical protein